MKSNRRRLGYKEFFGLICVLLFALCHSALAQQQAKVPRIGYLSASSASEAEGKNIVLANRWVRDKAESAQNLTAELVRLNVDVIVKGTKPAELPIEQPQSSNW